MTEHVILVAVVVEAPSRLAGEAELHRVMGLDKLQPRRSLLARLLRWKQTWPSTYVDSWWVAEDDRHDGSDNDSAVFCGSGWQRETRAAIVAAGLDHEKPGWKAGTYRLPD